MRSILFGLVVILFNISTAWSWGGTGHKTVCEIAFQELNNKAQAEVLRLIKTDPSFTKFYDSCTWADEPAQRHKRSSDHFLNVPRTKFEVTKTKCLTSNKCVTKAILEEVRILSDANTNDQDKLEALKYLSHWVGDIHQPLHISFKDDLGGNKIKLEQTDLCKYNLHSVWDSCIVNKSLGSEVPSIAEKLSKKITAADRTKWTDGALDGSAVAMWANESLQITIKPGVKYCARFDNQCVYELSNPTFEQGETEKIVIVNEAYIARWAPTIAERLRMAGVRLGYTLNAVLGK